MRLTQPMKDFLARLAKKESGILSPDWYGHQLRTVRALRRRGLVEYGPCNSLTVAVEFVRLTEAGKRVVEASSPVEASSSVALESSSPVEANFSKVKSMQLRCSCGKNGFYAPNHIVWKGESLDGSTVQVWCDGNITNGQGDWFPGIEVRASKRDNVIALRQKTAELFISQVQNSREDELPRLYKTALLVANKEGTKKDLARAWKTDLFGVAGSKGERVNGAPRLSDSQGSSPVEASSLSRGIPLAV